MRGLLVAFLAFELAGRFAPAGGRVRRLTKTPAKTTVATV